VTLLLQFSEPQLKTPFAEVQTERRCRENKIYLLQKCCVLGIGVAGVQPIAQILLLLDEKLIFPWKFRCIERIVQIGSPQIRQQYNQQFLRPIRNIISKSGIGRN